MKSSYIWFDLQCDDQAPCDTEHTICGKREPRDVSKLQSEKREIECRSSQLYFKQKQGLQQQENSHLPFRLPKLFLLQGRYCKQNSPLEKQWHPRQEENNPFKPTVLKVSDDLQVTSVHTWAKTVSSADSK